MYKVHEIFLPVRFMTLVLQIILSIVIIITKEDNIYAQIPASSDSTSSEYSAADASVTVGCICFFVCELAEIIILFSGMTMFINTLSLCQIFLHSVCDLLLSWFIFQQWAAGDIWTSWVIGGLIPILLEVGGILVTLMNYRKIMKIT